MQRWTLPISSGHRSNCILLLSLPILERVSLSGLAIVKLKGPHSDAREIKYRSECRELFCVFYMKERNQKQTLLMPECPSCF